MSLVPFFAPFFSGFKYDLQEYTGNSLTVAGSSIAVRSDGTRLLVLDGRLIRIYDMSTPNDISTASPNGFINLPSSTIEGDTVTTDLVSMRVSNDGLRLFVLDQTSEIIFAFTLSSSWGGSATYLTKLDTLGSIGTPQETFNAKQFDFTSDGTRIIGAGVEILSNGADVTEVFSQRDLSIAFDISSAGAWSGREQIFSGTADDVSGFRLANSDAQMVYCDAVNSRIRKSTLTTPGDIGTSTIESNGSLGDVTADGGGAPLDIAYGADGDVLYVMATDKVLEYRTIG